MGGGQHGTQQRINLAYHILSRSVREIKRNASIKFRTQQIPPEFCERAPEIILRLHNYFWSFLSAGDYLTK
jgi:hypothetical protein